MDMERCIANCGGSYEIGPLGSDGCQSCTCNPEWRLHWRWNSSKDNIIHSYIYSLTFYNCHSCGDVIYHWLKKLKCLYILYTFIRKKFCKAFIGKSWQNLTSTSNVLWRHDWCHARWISAYIWRIFAFFVLNGLHLLHQVTKN